MVQTGQIIYFSNQKMMCFDDGEDEWESEWE